MMEQEPRYPIGVQSFENIRLSGAVYADTLIIATFNSL
jgi:hypothetical protein